MDVLRATQLLTDFAYLLLGVAALGAALRVRERVRVDVALLFGTLALVVGMQEIELLGCAVGLGCTTPRVVTVLSAVLALVLPYALLRLLDDIADVPSWQLWLALVLPIALSVALILAMPEPPVWLALLMLLYLVVGTTYPALEFARRARATTGITRRRMAAVAWGCGFLALTFVLSLIGQASPRELALLPALGRVSGLVSGVCFWAGFFPPTWLSQTWRQKELLEYLRPTRLMAGSANSNGVVNEAVALDRLSAATARTTGARRVLLVLHDPAQGDLYLCGAPSARVDPDDGLVGQVWTTRVACVESLACAPLPASITAVFASETLPRSVMLVPIVADDRALGLLAAFADKGPMFVDDDLEVVCFFAGEAAAILQLRALRETASELEALREADRLKDEFMAVVSHELRTPLTAISGYADILLRKLSGPLTERQQHQLTGIREATRRLLLLINDLLDVSKLEAGTLDLHVSAVDPPAAIARAVAGTRVIAVTKGVQLSVRDSVDDLPSVSADDERLQQILTNLLSNAIKFTPPGGTIWIAATAEPRYTDARVLDVLFSVEDTGVGLPPGQAERIWDRFYQVEQTSTRRFGGAGLGLSIVRRLAELHGGRVEASSAGVNRGSTFIVRLPAAHDGAERMTVRRPLLPTAPTD